MGHTGQEMGARGIVATAQCPWHLSRGLALNYLSHLLGHVGITEEFVVLPIIKMKVRTVFDNLLRLIVGALGGPSNGGLIMGALP
jgi:hypothetical protein